MSEPRISEPHVLDQPWRVWATVTVLAACSGLAHPTPSMGQGSIALPAPRLESETSLEQAFLQYYQTPTQEPGVARPGVVSQPSAP